MFKLIISEQFFDKIKQKEERMSPQEQSYFYKLLRQQPVQVLTGADNEKLRSHPEDVLKNPSSLYILDITHSEAQAIQKSYGVMCMSSECPDISPLIDISDIHYPKEKEKLGYGWDTVLDSVEKLPSNALLLTDRYLFAFRHPSAGDGIANIKDILTELLPQQFRGGNYHVTIIFDNMAKDEYYSFSEIVRLLEEVKQQLKRDYPITMEVLGITPDCSIYNKLHDRMIISNYYLVEASHKLAAFNKGMGTVHQMLIPMTLFTESSLNGKSTPPLDAISQPLATLRKFSKSFTYLPESAHRTYLYAVNGKKMEKCLSIRNRLLK